MFQNKLSLIHLIDSLDRRNEEIAKFLSKHNKLLEVNEIMEKFNITLEINSKGEVSDYIEILL